MPGSGATRSAWMDGTSLIPGDGPLIGDTQADVCIIGAGVAGLTTGYLLAREGRSVVLIDDGAPGMGESLRTTAHLTAAIDDRIFTIEKVHGAKKARLVVQSQVDAIDRIERICADERMHGIFRRVDGYLFLHPDDKPETLKRELQAANKAGLSDVHLEVSAPLPFTSGPALVFPRQGEVDAGEYLAGLADAIRRMGGRIHAGTHATDLEDGPPAVVKTTSGRIECEAVVVCTDSPVFGKTPLHTKQEQFRTYVVAYEVPRGAVPRGLYWDTLERGYHYIRLCDRAEPGSELLIVGGEDHRTGDGDPKAALQRLEEWCSLRFGVSAPIHRWSGQVVEPADHLPFLGRYPGKGGHVYVITGDSGQGFTNHTCGAMLVTDLIQHRRNPYVALYKPSRQGFGAILKRLKGQATAAAAAVKEKAAPDVVVSEGEIPRGSGAIVERGGVKLACYRESTGELRECAAQCTHMGATVRWNDLEKTWDCPWHGSRFSPAGLPLDGPANKPLDAPPREDGPHDHDTEVNPMATTASRRTKRASGRTKSRSKPSRKTHAPAPKRARTGAGRTTRPRNSAARGQGTHDAIAMLKQDHRKVKGLLKKLDEAEEGSRRKSLFQDVEQELLVHARLEEELFYPAFKDAVGDDAEDKKMCFEAHEEHEVAERMAAEIRGHPNPGSDEYAAKCKVLKDLIEHHIKEEEEEMFPVAREEIGREQLLAVAEDMRQRKAEMLQGDVANLRRIAAPQDGIEPDQEPQDAPAAVRGGSRWSRMQRRE